MGEWKPTRLRDVGVSLIDCVHKTPEAQPAGYPYVGIPQMKNGRIDFSTARLISHEDYLEWTKKAKPQKHDVILSRRTNPGVTAVDDTETDFALGQNLVLLRASGIHVYPPFLKWMTLSPYWWEQIAKFNNVGAVFDSLKCADIPNFELPIPPREIQKSIASVLGALDDKIELNRLMNETLEAMARAIFKDWFVDFGPTRAKMEGHAPYGAPDIWSLFPDRLDDGGKPERWGTSTIGQEVEVVGGATPSTKEAAFWGGNISWATPKDLSSLSTPVLLSTERQITEAGLAQIGSGLLPVGTVLLSSRAPIGYMAIAQMPVAVNQGFIAMICKKLLSNVFVWLWTQANMETVHQNANGSTFQEISKANFRPIEVTIATPEILRAFDETARPLFDRIVANEKENRTLAATRDSLLPKLMSGEVRVRDAAKHSGQAT
ncbi:MAG: restriction endonuclease subunit S [Rhodocyclaceae bacterium]|nr:restriction endonuclease subunit S [Rhodocyclaceae bacterium]